MNTIHTTGVRVIFDFDYAETVEDILKENPDISEQELQAWLKEYAIEDIRELNFTELTRTFMFTHAQPL